MDLWMRLEGAPRTAVERPGDPTKGWIEDEDIDPTSISPPLALLRNRTTSPSKHHQRQHNDDFGPLDNLVRSNTNQVPSQSLDCMLDHLFTETSYLNRSASIMKPVSSPIESNQAYTIDYEIPSQKHSKPTVKLTPQTDGVSSKSVVKSKTIVNPLEMGDRADLLLKSGHVLEVGSPGHKQKVTITITNADGSVSVREEIIEGKVDLAVSW